MPWLEQRGGARSTHLTRCRERRPLVALEAGALPTRLLGRRELNTQRPAVAELTYEEGWWDQEAVRRAGRWYLPSGPPRAWLLPAPAAVSCAVPWRWVLLRSVV